MSCCRRRQSALCYGEVSEFYALEDQIAAGSTAIIRRGCHLKTNQAVAIKTIRLKDTEGQDLFGKRELDQFVTEANLTFSIRHPALLRSHGAFFGASTLDIVMELLLGGEVMLAFAEGNYHSEVRAQRILKQVCSAVSYLHAKSIAHRDVKAENVMYASNKRSEVKLVDFGCARLGVWNKVARRTLLGTAPYMAPEMFRAADSRSLKMGDRCVKYGTEVDMWAVGVFAYVVLFGLLPFAPPRLQKGVLEDDFQLYFPEEQRDDYSTHAESFLTACLERDPGKRLTAAGACAHAWMVLPLEEEMVSRFSTWQQNVRTYVEATEDEDRVMPPDEMVAMKTSPSEKIRRWERNVEELDPNESADEGAEQEGPKGVPAVKIVITRRATQSQVGKLGEDEAEVILDPEGGSEPEKPQENEQDEESAEKEKRRRGGMPKKRSATPDGEVAAGPVGTDPSDGQPPTEGSKVKRKVVRSSKSKKQGEDGNNSDDSPTKARKTPKKKPPGKKGMRTSSSLDSTETMPDNSDAEGTTQELRLQVLEASDAHPAAPAFNPDADPDGDEEARQKVADRAFASDVPLPQPFASEGDEDPAKGDNAV